MALISWLSFFFLSLLALNSSISLRVSFLAFASMLLDSSTNSEPTRVTSLLKNPLRMATTSTSELCRNFNSSLLKEFKNVFLSCLITSASCGSSPLGPNAAASCPTPLSVSATSLAWSRILLRDSSTPAFAADFRLSLSIPPIESIGCLFAFFRFAVFSASLSTALLRIFSASSTLPLAIPASLRDLTKLPTTTSTLELLFCREFLIVSAPAFICSSVPSGIIPRTSSSAAVPYAAANLLALIDSSSVGLDRLPTFWASAFNLSEIFFNACNLFSVTPGA